tara:strand:- start:755 stop:952 length:198 start_codon:yes stop_codon:yes gene_type:complete
MERKYGDEQRSEITKIKLDLIDRIQTIYLETFNELNSRGIGEAAIASLTQTLLISRERALEVLRD